jgi:hypothetical protein
MAVAEMSRAQFKIAYDGSAIADGSMETRPRSKALLAVPA